MSIFLLVYSIQNRYEYHCVRSSSDCLHVYAKPVLKLQRKRKRDACESKYSNTFLNTNYRATLRLIILGKSVPKIRHANNKSGDNQLYEILCPRIAYQMK